MPAAHRLGATLIAVLAVGCSGDDESSGGGGGEAGGGAAGAAGAGGQGGAGGAGAPERIAVTADFLNGSLSVLDYDAVVAGAATRDEALHDTIDLSAFSPGPLEVELTPDGTTALVSISPGFFDGPVGGLAGITGVPSEDGAFVIVDLESHETTEVLTGPKPMGIAVSPDGKRAYVANFGTDTLSIVDIEARALIENVTVGAGPEQVALDEAGALGIVNAAGDGTVRVFETSDVAGTLSAPVAVSDDPSGVAFVPGTSKAVVANSVNRPNYTVLDVSTPSAPVIVEESDPPGGVPYGASALPGTQSVMLTVTTFVAIRFVRVDLTADPSTTEQLDVAVPGFPLGIAFGPTHGLAGAPGANVLVVIDLTNNSARTIPWLDSAGPSYVAIERSP